jgi:hypothetical protein
MPQTQGQSSTFFKKLLDLRAQIDPNTVIAGDLNTPTVTNRQVIQAKDQQGIFIPTSQVRQKGHDRPLQSISPNKQQVHVIFQQLMECSLF